MTRKPYNSPELRRLGAANYDELAYAERDGRYILEAKLRAAVRELKLLDANLIAVQQRCTELLEEARALRAVASSKQAGHTCGVLGPCDGSQ
jgi:hypothetical protein